MLRTTSRILTKLILSGALALGFAIAIVATQAAHPVAPGSTSQAFLSGSQPAAAYGGDPHWHRGWYANHGRYWQHRRWHPAYYGPRHAYHPGFYIYF